MVHAYRLWVYLAQILFTGEMGIHSKHEYVSVQDMEKAVKTMVELVGIWCEETKINSKETSLSCEVEIGE
jgi:acetylornithine deacetylase/succinyl-diaminopimelate desuccinylase-like protein